MWEPHEDIVTFGFFGLPGFEHGDTVVKGAVRIIAYYTLYRQFKKGARHEPYGYPVLGIYGYNQHAKEFQMLSTPDPVRPGRPLGYWVFQTIAQWTRFTNRRRAGFNYRKHPWYMEITEICAKLRAARKSIWRNDGEMISTRHKASLGEEAYTPAHDSVMMIRGFTDCVPRRLFASLGSAEFVKFKPTLRKPCTMYTDEMTGVYPRIENLPPEKLFCGRSKDCPTERVFV